MIELAILMVVMIGFMWIMQKGARKAQQAQLDQRAAAVVVGNNVVTSAGFFGRIVDIDGDAVTLESPNGDESVWLKSSIMAQMDIPLAPREESLEELIEGGVPGYTIDETTGNLAKDPATPAEGIQNSSPFEEGDPKPGSAWK